MNDHGSIAVRRATTIDAPAILAVTRAAYAKWVPLIGREPRPMTADYDAALQNHQIELLQIGGVIVGLIELALETDHVLIINVAVDPAFQGKGHGQRLLAHAETVAASLGSNEMRLYTNGNFTDNVRLYKKVGYKVDREESHPQFGMTIYMSKPIDLPLLPPG